MRQHAHLSQHHPAPHAQPVLQTKGGRGTRNGAAEWKTTATFDMEDALFPSDWQQFPGAPPRPRPRPRPPGPRRHRRMTSNVRDTFG